MPAQAYDVLEDSQTRLVLKDEVADHSVYSCTNEVGELKDGFQFSPESAVYEDGNDVPYRKYRLALPGNQLPDVSLSDVKTVALGKKTCKDAKYSFSGVKVSKPFFKDGLWMTDVMVPLYEKSGSSVALRTSFKLDVSYGAAGAGVNPGSRAVSRVINPKAAARFGVNRASTRKALRRAAADELSDVRFLARIFVGDKNIATNSEDGLYAVDFASLRAAMQLEGRQQDIDGIKVGKIRLYGASPDTLPDMGPGSELRNPNQLFEIPIEIRDHSKSSSAANGIFDDGDTLLFVGYGNSFWKRCDREDPDFVNGNMDYFHSYSPYSFYQGFLLGLSDKENGARIKNIDAPKGSAKSVDWMRYVRAEKDVFLRDSYFGKELEWESETGKEWFWIWHSRLDSTIVSNSELSMAQVKNLDGLVSGGRQYAALSYYPYRSVWSSDAEKKDDQVSNLTMSGAEYTDRMKGISFKFNVNGNEYKKSQSVLIPGGNFRIDFPGLKSSDNSYTLTMLPNAVQFDRFDGFTVAYQWNPKADSSEWLLPGKVGGVIEVPMSSSNVRVMKFVNFEPVGTLSFSNGVARDSVSTNDDIRYLAYNNNLYKKPAKIEAIPAHNSYVLSDISRINSETEYLIIAPNEFLDAAVALGKFRAEGDAVKTYAVSVVSVDDIYDRYTGGTLSPIAIRNYISYAYEVCPSLKYVLLAGSGHFDYKQNNAKFAKNYIPPFEKEDAVTEDFFAALDSGEIVRYGEYDLDVAVGRLPVSSAVEFANYIEKAKDYERIGTFDPSSWRSTLLLSADDAKNGASLDRTRHTVLQEGVANALDSLFTRLKFRWNLKKIYLLDYLADAAGQKNEAANDFLNIMNQGALMTTYFGHGSMTDWAGEGLLKPGYISRLSNKKRYTILNSFSCTVGRFDEGKKRSLSEEFILAKGVGSIVSIGATRETFASYNVEFGRTFMVNALGKKITNLGDAFLSSKNISSANYSRQRYNNEHYVFIGEPVIQMPMPTMSISFDQKIDTVKALDKMKISGTVSGMSEGSIDIALREGRYTKRISQEVDDDSVDVTYTGGIIYSEELPVKNGRFETEFITPKKINFGDTTAEFFAWAYSPNEKNIGRMLKADLRIAGISSYADSIHDDVAPSIKIQPCYSSGMQAPYADGQVVKLQTPACIQITMEDSTALDFREEADEGISYEIEGVENATHPYPYLEQSSKRAVFRKTFATEAYPNGKYVFKVRAMDVLGNVSSKKLNIELTGDMKEGLADVFNVPNPVGKKGTTFYFKNLATDRSSTVDIFIYNQNGKLVKVLKNAVSGITHWDGRDNHGRKLANGLYHYAVRSEVAATENFKKKTFVKKQKLLISR